MRRIALICATALSVAMIAAVLVSDIFLRPVDEQLAEEWDGTSGVVLGVTGLLIIAGYIGGDDD